MPQMAPMNWIMLFTLFNLILFYLISYINFLKLPNLKPKMQSKKKIFFWKW